MSAGHAWLRLTLREFVESAAHQRLGRVSSELGQTGFVTHQVGQIRAWTKELEVLDAAFRELFELDRRSPAWSVLLEYEIPRRERRVDAVLIVEGVVIVMEVKVGKKAFDRADRWQVEDYALDLRDFHRESRDVALVPVLVATEAETAACGSVVGPAGELYLSNATTLAKTIAAIAQGTTSTCQLDPAKWDGSGYQASPGIVEATQSLFRGHTIRELAHAHADNLSATVETLVREVRRAAETRRRIVCFVTGVPGAGKTLAGLAAVHDPSVATCAAGESAFMSGNGPLVAVLREAVVRDGVNRGVADRQELKRRARLMIQNVHGFIDEYGVKRTSAIPPEHVIVFDEAQRAWDAKKLSRRHEHLQASEPDLVLDIFSRVPDWAVVIAIVGGGQEIHDGEAGLEEWGHAIARSKTEWDVVVSPQVVAGGPSVAERRLFSSVPSQVRVSTDQGLDLSVSTRSLRAQKIAEWVDAVLAMRADKARAAVADMTGFRLAYTRSLSEARDWLRDAGREDRRYGLVTSSGNLRIRAYGLEVDSAFRRAYPKERWFLDPPSDIRSSFQLEVAMTEFECQGLEIDFAGVCWGDDLTVDESSCGWSPRALRGNRWQEVKGRRRDYLINKYRVLLTRAREGLLVWIPSGASADRTRNRDRLDRTAAFLEKSGMPALA